MGALGGLLMSLFPRVTFRGTLLAVSGPIGSLAKSPLMHVYAIF